MQIELKRLQAELGITFIYITHDQEEALTMSDRIAVMRDGLFEQIGEASEIYKRPRTSFVARFVGGANIVEGKVISQGPAGDGSILLGIETPSGRGGVIFRPDGKGHGPPGTGSPAAIAVRSEHIVLDAAAPDAADGSVAAGSPAAGAAAAPDADGLRAEIREKSFAGGQLRILAVLEDGAEITASRHGIDTPLKTGERVLVRWSPENAVLVDAVPADGRDGNGA
jgi:spermidine/putrescine transport system ATP-binding protein